MKLRANRVSQRLTALQDTGLNGFEEISTGMNRLLSSVVASEETSRLLDSLEILCETFESRGPSTSFARQTTRNTEEKHFLELFRSEAKKRLVGLSISIMDLFYDPMVATDVSTGHLHAIKGSAAMLGLNDIQRLCRAMERVVFAVRDREGTGQPALKPLLRAYAILESLIDDPDMDAADIVDQSVFDLDAVTGWSDPSSPETTDTSDDTKKPSVVTSQEKRILIVDDEETIAASIGFVLSELDVPIDIAVDGREALARLQSTPYSLVITDYQMPEMNGIELLEAMKQSESLSDIPVVLLTGKNNESDDYNKAKTMFEDCIIKGSIGGGELVARVNGLLLEAPSVPQLQSTQMKILVVEDAETVAASIALVLSEGEYDIQLAHHGAEAWEALGAQHFDLVISDLWMPTMNGMELLKRVKSDSRLATTKFILMTGSDDPDHERAAFATGADRFVIKGQIGGSELLAMVREVID